MRGGREEERGEGEEKRRETGKPADCVAPPRFRGHSTAEMKGSGRDKESRDRKRKREAKPKIDKGGREAERKRKGRRSFVGGQAVMKAEMKGATVCSCDDL